jgi:hypothetical protein
VSAHQRIQHRALADVRVPNHRHRHHICSPLGRCTTLSSSSSAQAQRRTRDGHTACFPRGRSTRWEGRQRGCCCLAWLHIT